MSSASSAKAENVDGTCDLLTDPERSTGFQKLFRGKVEETKAIKKRIKFAPLDPAGTVQDADDAMTRILAKQHLQIEDVEAAFNDLEVALDTYMRTTETMKEQREGKTKNKTKEVSEMEGACIASEQIKLTEEERKRDQKKFEDAVDNFESAMAEFENEK